MDWETSLVILKERIQQLRDEENALKAEEILEELQAEKSVEDTTEDSKTA